MVTNFSAQNFSSWHLIRMFILENLAAAHHHIDKVKTADGKDKEKPSRMHLIFVCHR